MFQTEKKRKIPTNSAKVLLVVTKKCFILKKKKKKIQIIAMFFCIFPV